MNIQKRNVLLIFLTVLTAICGVLFLLSFNYGKSNATAISLFMPSSSLEYYRLKNPVDVSYSDDSYAILENTGTEQNIVYYKNGNYTLFKGSSLTPKLADNMQIKTVNNFIITQQTARPYALNAVTGAYFKISDDITCKHFDFNDRFFVALDNSKAYIYNMVVGESITLSSTGLSIEVSSSINIVAINDNDDIFYFNTAGFLCKRNITSIINPPSMSVNIGTPNYIIADNNKVYFSADDKICIVDIKTSVIYSAKETVSTATYKGLGEIVSPKGMSFKNGNLLIADSTKNTVQEFAIKNNGCVFTGFAVATTENYKNRITESTVDICTLGEYTYTLESNYVKMLSSDLSKCKVFDISAYTLTFTPTSIATDGKTICVASSTGVLIIKISDSTVVDLRLALDSCCCSLTYSQGNYYILSYDISVTHYGRIFKIPANAKSYPNKDYVDLDIKTINNASLIASDVDGYFYVYTEDDKTIRKLNNDGTVFKENGVAVSYVLSNNAKKIQADVAGNVFSLADGNKIERIIDGENKSVYLLTVPDALTTERFNSVKALSFAVAYDKTETQFIFDNEGFILQTTDLGNLSTKNIPVPSGLCLNGNTPDLNVISTVTVSKGTNIYAVNYTDGDPYFTYEETISSADKTFACSKETSGFYILLSDTLYLVRKSFVKADTSPIKTITQKHVYATTNVNLYYLPVLANNYNYSITDSTANVKIEKASELLASSTIKVDNYIFYLVTYTTAEKTYTGFVPESFVTDNLAELYIDTNSQTFTSAKVNANEGSAVSVYADKEKSTVIYLIKKDVNVNVYDKDGEFALVSFTVDGTTYNGYIESDRIANDGAVSVTRSLTLILVATSVSVTSIFLIVRKKKPE